MADRIYPSAKPSSSLPPQSNPTTNTSFPNPKSHLYRPPAYRPAPKSPPRRRSRCCSCCLWLIFVIFFLIILAAIAAAVIYLLYRPHRPTFSVSTLRFSSFNLTSNHLNSHLNLSISARNPNKKLVFYYDPVTVSIFSNGVDIGDGSFPSFIHPTKNTTLLKTTVSSGNSALDSASASSISSDLKLPTGLPLQIRLETKVKVKMGGLKTKKVKIRVNCVGINAAVPTKKSKSAAAPASVSDAKCKVKVRVKIWKWQL